MEAEARDIAARREPLSRDRILRAALALADGHGVEAVTMRRLGEELGFEAMSLYRHVANKDDVLDGILDLVLHETEPPPPDGDWDAAIRRSALSVRDALRRHPWATGLLMKPGHARPARLHFMDSLLGRLRRSGFSADQTFVVYHVLDGHIFGFALWQTAYESVAAADPEVVARLMREIPFDDYPHLAEHRDQHLEEGPHREVGAFELGLDLILDGLRRMHADAR
jgi:AcrR family transcriptional regulator